MSFGFTSGVPIYNAPPGCSSNCATDVDVGRAASDIKAGAIIRFPIGWKYVQKYCLDALGNKDYNNPILCKTPGPYDWSALDGGLNQIGSYLAAGTIKLIPNPSQAPQWAWGTSSNEQNDSSEDNCIGDTDVPPGNNSTALTYWEEFVRDLVAHIEGKFPQSNPIYGVEMWNEENGTCFWTTNGGVDPVWYTNVLCKGYFGVHDAGYNLPVILGGVNSVQQTDVFKNPPLDTTYYNMTVSHFLNAAYSAYKNGAYDIRSCMNSLGIHPYPFPNNYKLPSPEDPSTCANYVANYVDPPTNTCSGFQVGLHQARDAASANSDAGRSLAITEVGYYIASSTVTETQQASYETQSYNLAVGMSDVGLIIIHTLFDTSSFKYGVCAAPQQPRAAASAFKQLFSGNPSAIATC
jgi:hypothetical protein